ncbi:hypothetical protein BDF19DRAFT_424127 [Syncephalis fuscata]|nr:hypothetical protein BDF19DRAFT_424127 [Syncephalis fuscata]
MNSTSMKGLQWPKTSSITANNSLNLSIGQLSIAHSAIEQQQEQPQQTTPEPYFPLGKSLRLLLNCRQAVLDKQYPIWHRDNVVTQALYSLDIHLGPSQISPQKEDPSGSTNLVLLENTCLLLQERLIEKQTKQLQQQPSEKEAALCLLLWLLRSNQHGKLLKQYICRVLCRSDKRKKLSMVTMIQQIWQSLTTPTESSNNRTQLFTDAIAVWGLSQLVDIINALAWSANNDGLLVDNKKQATRLTEMCVSLTVEMTETWSIIAMMVERPLTNSTPNRLIIVIEEEEEEENSDIPFDSILPSLIMALDNMHHDTWLQTQGQQALVDKLKKYKTDCQTAGSLQQRHDTIRQVAIFWSLVAPALKSNVTRMPRSKFILLLEETINKVEHSNPFACILNVILLLARRKSSFVDELLQPTENTIDGAQSVYDSIIHMISMIMGSSSEIDIQLAFIIVRRMIMASKDTLDSVKELVGPLMVMSGERDAVSQARLKDNDRIQQRGALMVLKNISIHPDASLLLNIESNHLLELKDQLMIMLTIDDVELRNITAQLFRYLPYDTTLSTLMKQLTNTDERVRSANEQALLDALLYHNSGIVVWFKFIELIRELFNTLSSDTTRLQDASAQVIAKWSYKVPSQLWFQLIPELIRVTYEYADNRGMIMIWRTIGHVWLELPTAVPITLQHLIDIMNKQDHDSLNEQNIQRQLCTRLCPLLILKTIPNGVFDAAEETQDLQIIEKTDVLRDILYQRCEAEQDALAIRRVAYDVIVKLPNIFPLISNQLRQQVESGNNNYLAIRNWLYALHQYITRYFGHLKQHSIEQHEDRKEALYSLMENTVLLLIQQSSHNDGAQEVTFACMDTFSVLLSWSIINDVLSISSVSPSTNTLIVELNTLAIEPTSPKLFIHLIHRLLELLGTALSTDLITANEHSSLGICMVNILIMTARRLSSQLLGGQDEHAMKTPQWLSDLHHMQALNTLANHTMPVLFPTLQTILTSFKSNSPALNQFNRLLASCFQYMFHYTFLYKTEFKVYYEEMVDLAINLLITCPVYPITICAEARLQAIKVLLALLVPRTRNTTAIIVMTPWRLSRLQQIHADTISSQASSTDTLVQERLLLTKLLTSIDAIQ